MTNELHALLPSVEDLTAGLSAVLAGRVAVIERIPNDYASTFPSEFVTCRLANGNELRLLCKYEAGQDHNAYGHRGGVEYEAAVYEKILRTLPLTSPKFYGTYTGSNDFWLFVEHVHGSVGVDEAQSPADALALACRWVGQFHALTGSTGGLNTYDGEYYAQWARRASEFAGRWHQRLPWLSTLCARVEGFADSMLALPRTVIHGEFTPSNVLIRDGKIYPVDWESAAISFGEIDLVSITEKWPDEIARRCEAEYQRSRWPEGAPTEFERWLDVARVYWDFRWLGDRPEWLTYEKVGARFEHLRAAAERLGLL